MTPRLILSLSGCWRCGATPWRALARAFATCLLDELQIEPSHQFGTVLRAPDTGKHTHFLLHYTFGHQISLEGVPMFYATRGECTPASAEDSVHARRTAHTSRVLPRMKSAWRL